MILPDSGHWHPETQGMACSPPLLPLHPAMAWVLI